MFIFLEIQVAWPPGTSGYGDGHRVQMYVSITINIEGVMAILMISRSRGGHFGFIFWKSIRSLHGHPNTSGYDDGHRGQMFILALKVILLDRLQGINCSGIQEP